MAVEINRRVGGPFQKDFCSAPHPDNREPTDDLDDEVEWVYCRRQKNHTSEHSAFVFSIKEPQTWV